MSGSEQSEESRGREPEGSYEVRPRQTQRESSDNASGMFSTSGSELLESSAAALDDESLPQQHLVEAGEEEGQVEGQLNDETYDYQNDQDLALALALQEQLNTRTSKRSPKSTAAANAKHAEPSQATTSAERAWEFTTKLVAGYEAMRDAYAQDALTQPLSAGVSLVNADDVLFYTEHLLQHLQEALGDKHVDIGYLINYSDHVDEPDGPDRIRSRSLWTVGGQYGDGIYLSNNPLVTDEAATGSYKVMMMARLKGAVIVAGEVLIDGLSPYDSIIAHKNAFAELCVLTRPTQCIPLLILDSTILDWNDDASAGNAMVFSLHSHFQQILDEYFNVGKGKTSVLPILPSHMSKIPVEPSLQPPALAHSTVSTLNCVVHYSAPESVNGIELHSVPSFLSIPTHSKPTTLIINNHSTDPNQEKQDPRGRALRHCSSWINYVSIIPSVTGDADVPRISLAYSCGSTFDVSLAQGSNNESSSEIWSAMLANPIFLQRLQLRASEHAKKCPMCREATDTQEDTLTVGCMPTGSMRIDKRLDLRCQGHDDVGTYLISYRFESGLQKNYHEHPGVTYSATVKEAYVPCTKEGRDLLKRLVIAFACGMTFKVGTSISSGKANRVTFTTISHKTSLLYGPFGYPDPDFFRIVNEDLDALGIPTARQL